VCTFPDYTRSYVGYQMSAMDRDIAPDAPTIFELCIGSVGALNLIGRGLPLEDRIGAVTGLSALRAARTHFAGNLGGWLNIDREVAMKVTRRIRQVRPEFAFAALTGVDKVSHSRGHDSPMIMEALQIVDDTAAQIRDDAERAGRWEDMSLWVVSDHGHSRVTNHEDLAGIVAAAGHRTMAHPWVFTPSPDIAVMVSGNAMAHLYIEVRSPRAAGDALGPRWTELLETLLARPSVDIALVRGERDVAVHSGTRGSATAWFDGDRYYYRRETGDPLGIGCDLDGVSANDAYDATIDTDYPDGLVQIVQLARSPRSGEIILSAARDWDFRARYEPIRHVSSHGALHREHILVPLLVNRPVHGRPRRTVDVMPSALEVLGKTVPLGLDGTSFS
jgi:hypothetical protein